MAGLLVIGLLLVMCFSFYFLIIFLYFKVSVSAVLILSFIHTAVSCILSTS